MMPMACFIKPSGKGVRNKVLRAFFMGNHLLKQVQGLVTTCPTIFLKPQSLNMDSDLSCPQLHSHWLDQRRPTQWLPHNGYITRAFWVVPNIQRWDQMESGYPTPGVSEAPMWAMTT